jgi:methyl-galactoside transport system ATP-binding protein
MEIAKAVSYNAKVLIMDEPTSSLTQTRELTTDLIIKRMVGRDLSSRFPSRSNSPGPVVLKVEGLGSAEHNSFRDVSLELREGEILGLGGLVGAKRTELVESIFGMRPVASGKVYLRGKPIPIDTPIGAKKTAWRSSPSRRY